MLGRIGALYRLAWQHKIKELLEKESAALEVGEIKEAGKYRDSIEHYEEMQQQVK